MAAAVFGCAVGENEAVTDAASSAVLSAREKQAAEAVLTRVGGERAQVGAAERIWDRDRVLRLELADGRSVVLKRRGDQEDDAGDRSFETELAALDLLNGMPVPVAPACWAPMRWPASCSWKTSARALRWPIRC